MSIGNLGASLNLLEGFLASEFDAATYNRTQGTAAIVDMVRQIASRADLTYSNLRVTAPALFDGTNEVTVETGAVGLIAIIAATNSSAAEDEAVLVYEAAVTEGTTRFCAMLNVDAAGTTATGTMYSVVFPEPLAMAKLYWSVVDNGSDTDIEGTTLGDANGTKVMLVYAE
jgi:hypothetical protein